MSDPAGSTAPAVRAPGRLSGERARLAREGTWISVGQALSLVGRLVGIRVLTGLVSPEVYGLIAVLQGLATFGNNLVCNPLLQATLRFYPEAQRDGRVNALRRLVGGLLRRITVGVVVALLAGGAIWTLGGVSSAPYFAIVALALALPLDVWRGFETCLQNAARHQRAQVVWSTLDNWGRPLGAACAVLLIGSGATAVLLGYAFAGAAINLMFRGSIVLGGDDPDEPGAAAWVAQFRMQVIRYATPLVPLAVFTWIMTYADRYFIAGLAGTREAGLYVAVYGLAAQPFGVLAGISQTTLRPVLFQAVAQGDAARERRVIVPWLAIVASGSLVGVILMTTLAKLAVRIALGEAYRSAWPLIPWIASGWAFWSIQTVFEGMIYARRTTSRMLFVNVVSGASALIFYALLIPRHGARGAAMAVLASFAISCMTACLLADAPRRLLGRARRSDGTGSPDGSTPPAETARPVSGR